MRDRTDFSTVRVVGGLLPTALLERIGAEDPELEAINPADYYLAPGERLGEAITRSWNRLLGLWKRFEERLDSDDPQVGATRQEWLLPLFQELGYGHLANAPGFEIENKSYPISHVWESVPIHLLGVGVDLNKRSSGVAGAASSSPHGLVQEFLNRTDNHLWAILANGVQLRLLRDNASLTRNAYVEFDLREMFSDMIYSDFALLWLTCHASRLEGPAGKVVLESWRDDAAKRGVRALDALRDGVESAIETLGSAVLSHPSNSEVRHQLERGSLDAQELYRQLLRVVYRLLFLLVAEARGLLLEPRATQESRARYSDHYSMARLRDLAETTRGSSHTDLWAQHLIVAKVLESDGASDLGLPALGGFLWSSQSTSALNGAEIPNEAFLSAIRSLTRVMPKGELLQRVDYANLGPEELGSVYESLLEYSPEINQRAGSFVLKAAAGNERKTTGSYYTPKALIDELLSSSLDQVVEEAAHSDNPEHAILNLKVVDPAAGSGHFLIAAANRMADRLARIRSVDEEPSPEELGAAVRDVIAHCIYAVDVNPMAVELAKVALWLEGMEPGKPLTFLDHHVVCGNSLLGATPRLLQEGIPNEAFVALTGDDKEHVKGLKARNRDERKKRLVALPFGDSPYDLLSQAAAELAEIDAMGDGSLSEVEEKRRRYDRLVHSNDRRRLQLAADVWVAAFVAPKTPEHPAITHAVMNIGRSDPDQLSQEVANFVEGLRDEFRFHHWHLIFPNVFVGHDLNGETGWSGGFDVVLGNPPFVDSETMSSSDPRMRKVVASLFSSATGNWDSYVTFVEVASRIVRLGGLFALVTPTKLLASRYAAAVQSLILERTPTVCMDFSELDIFPGVRVWVVVLVVRNQPADPEARVEFRKYGDGMVVVSEATATLAALRRLPPGFICLPTVEPDPGVLELFEAKTRMLDVASVSDGASTGEAYKIKEIVEAGTAIDASNPAVFRLVNTGTIDPFRTLWGEKEIAYLGIRERFPVVRREALEALAPRRAEQALSPKVLVAGLAKEIEAVADQGGILCGKSAVVIVTSPEVCPFALATILNSTLLRRLYESLYGLRALGGEWISFGPRELEQLPMPANMSVLKPHPHSHRSPVFDAGVVNSLKLETGAVLRSRVDTDANLSLIGWMAHSDSLQEGERQDLGEVSDRLVEAAYRTTVSSAQHI